MKESGPSTGKPGGERKKSDLDHDDAYNPNIRKDCGSVEYAPASDRRESLLAIPGARNLCRGHFRSFQEQTHWQSVRVPVSAGAP